MSPSNVIAVDLDGTLTLTDTFHEAVLVLGRSKPCLLLLLPIWLIKGIAYLKFKVSQNSFLNEKMLPYNLPFIYWLKEERGKGKKLILITAANESIANAVSEHLGIFDEVIASDSNINIKGITKRNLLIERFGHKGYAYAGNSADDIHVWASSYNAIVVNASSTVEKKASQVASISHTFPSQKFQFVDLLSALRIQHWIKNSLLFVPILAAHQLSNVQSIITLMIAFVSFSLCASSVYIINDLFDLERDRYHPSKKNRPFASAKLPILFGVLITPFLMLSSLILGNFVGNEFLLILFTYFLISILYCSKLKKIALVDCLTLAILHIIRLIAGGSATSIVPSFWLLAFSGFIFLSLAFVKRYVEINNQSSKNNLDKYGRPYRSHDTSIIQLIGITSGYISSLILAFYIQTKHVTSLYSEPKIIWLAIPIIMFGISWIWLNASRGKLHDDPVVFALKDKVSLLVAVLFVAVFVFANYRF